jgi:hypothetical protein
MKETVKSLRAYFVAVGLLGGYFAVTSLAGSPGVVEMVFSVASLLIALGFLYVGAALPSVLAKAPERIYALVGINAGIAVLRGLLVAVVAFSAPTFPVYAFVVQSVVLAICWYLFVNVKRLSAAARALPTPG